MTKRTKTPPKTAKSLQSFQFIPLTNLSNAESLAFLASLEMSGYLRSNGESLISVESISEFMWACAVELQHNNKLVKYHEDISVFQRTDPSLWGVVQMSAPQMDFTTLDEYNISEL